MLLILQVFAVLALLFLAQSIVRWTVRHFGEHDWRDGLALLLLGLALTTAAGLVAVVALGSSE